MDRAEPLRFTEHTREDRCFPGGLASFWVTEDKRYWAAEVLVCGRVQVDGWAGNHLIVMADSLRETLATLQYVETRQAWPIKVQDRRANPPVFTMPEPPEPPPLEDEPVAPEHAEPPMEAAAEVEAWESVTQEAAPPPQEKPEPELQGSLF